MSRQADMEELMRRLHGQFGGGGAARERFSQIAQRIGGEDESEKYTALTELVESLNMATEDIMRGIRVEQLVPPTTACLRLEHNPELMYLAARVLTYMTDAIPQTAAAIAQCNGIPLLCEKLMAITDIELAEQCISCLHKISQVVQGPILDSGGPMALLAFVDFFGIAVQRTAVSTVANACKNVKPGKFSMVQGVLAQLRQFAQHDDDKVAEHAITALARIANGVKSSPEQALEVFADSSPLLVELLETKRSGPRLMAAVQFLVAVADVAACVEVLVELGVLSTIATVLASSSTGSGGGGNDGSSPEGKVGASPCIGATPPQGPASPPQDAAATPPRDAGPASPMQGSTTPPQTSAAGGGSAARKRAPLPPDVIVDLTRVLRALLPAPQEDFTLYMNGPGLIVHDRRRRDLGLDDDDEDEHAEEDDEDHDDEDEDDDDDGQEDEEEAPRRMSRQSSTASGGGPRGRHHELHRRMVRQLFESRGVRIENDDRWRGLPVGRHSCDGCGKRRLAPGDWYRDNDADDADMCERCAATSPEAAGRSYTDMQELLGDSAAAGAARAPAEAPKERAATRTELHAMYERAPYLLERVAEVAGVAMGIAVEVENPRARMHCIELVHRLCGSLNAEAAATLVSSSHLGPLLVTLLRAGQQRLGDVAMGVYIVQKIVSIAPDTCREAFIRDGVLHSLAEVRKLGRGSSSPATPTSPVSPAGAALQPLHLQLATEHGWRKLLAQRAAVVVKGLAGGEDRPAAQALKAASDALDEDNDAPLTTRWTTAVGHVARAVSLGASSFEILSSGVIDAILHRLQDRPTSAALLADAVQLVGTLIDAGETLATDATTAAAGAAPALGDASPNTSIRSAEFDGIGGNLLRLVRACQALVNQLETFTTTPTRRPIHLHITNADGPSSAGTSPTDQDPGSSSRRRRQQLGAGDGREVKVGIEALAPIAAVADFIAQRMLRMAPPGLGGMGTMQRTNSHEVAGRPEDEEQVESILTNLGDTAARAGGAAGSTTVHDASAPLAVSRQTSTASGNGDGDDATPSIFIRYGEHTLPHSLSMQQVLLQFVPPEKHGQPIPLHFSTKPFATNVAKPEPSAGQRDDTFSPSYSTGVLFRAASDVRDAVSDKMAVSASEGTESLLPVLRVLRVINAVTSNPQSVLDWYKAVGRTTNPELQTSVSAITRFVGSHDGQHALAHELQNAKIESKVLRCVDGPGCVAVLNDSWCVALAEDCPFLMSANVRRLIFEVAFFGTSRALNRVLEHCKEMEIPVAAHHKNHRVAKMKFRVWRQHPLECARNVFERYGNARSMFDFQYYGEVGSGLGPTHEFFHLVGDALHSDALDVWRAGEPGEAFSGVFLKADAASASGERPSASRPMEPRKAGSTACPQACLPAAEGAAGFVGSFLARTLMDHHVVNVRLSHTMLRLLQGRPMVLEDVRDVSPGVYETLHALVASHAEDKKTVAVGYAKEVAIDDLGLAFVLPGREEIPLCPGGGERSVDAKNAFDFVEGVGRVMLCDGVRTRASTMCEAFNHALSRRAVRLFTASELHDLFCGHDTVVPTDEWARHVLCDHGFTSSSNTVRFLFEALGEMSLAEQQDFIRFVTGSRQLPVGGIAALKPRMTIVRKKTDGTVTDEMRQLPSAMTCQNYIKLPAYDSKAQLVAKLRQAITEGAGSFAFT